MSRFSFFLIFIAFISVSSWAKRKITLAEHIDIVSTNVVEGMAIDRERVADTLFIAFRPRVKVSQDDLSDEEIDSRVKSYIKQNFVLSMVGEYVKIYGLVKNANAKVLKCGEPDFFGTKENVQEALCIGRFRKRTLVLVHMIKEDKKQRVKSIYKFEGKTLIGVTPKLRENVDVIIDGL